MSASALAARKERVRVGALYMLLASLLFAAMGLAIRAASVELNNAMIVFLRNAFGMLFLLPMLLKLNPSGLATRRPLTHMVRALIGLASMYCFFYTIPRLPVAEAMLLNFCVPLYMPLIAWFLIKEKTSFSTAVAIVVGFIGLLFIVGPKEFSLSSGAVSGVASGVFAAIALTMVRRLSSTEPAARIVFYFAFYSVIISAGFALFDWQFPSPAAWALMVVAGLCGTCAQLSISKAYEAATAAKVSVFNYASAVWAALGSWLFWGVLPSSSLLYGAGLIAFAGAIVAVQAGLASKHSGERVVLKR